MTSKCFLPRDYFTLEFIPFVASTKDSKSELKGSNLAKETLSKSLQITSSFTGNEASDFYKNVLSISTATTVPKINSKPLKQEKKHNIVKTNCNPNYFHKYAQEGDLNSIKLCMNTNLDLLNTQDMYGWTPLMCASCEGQFSTVKFLIESGANLNIKNKEGMTALELAVAKKHIDIVDLLKNGVPSPIEQKTPEYEETVEWYCKDCKLLLRETRTVHIRSIAHLFNTKKAKDTTFYHIPENNKGFQIMLKSGWDQNKGLGSRGEGQKFPIKTILKRDRSCIGKKKEVARVTHFNACDPSAVQRVGDPPLKIVRETTLKKWQRVKLEQKNRKKEIEFRREFLCNL